MRAVLHEKQDRYLHAFELLWVPRGILDRQGEERKLASRVRHGAWVIPSIHEDDASVGVPSMLK